MSIYNSIQYTSLFDHQLHMQPFKDSPLENRKYFKQHEKKFCTAKVEFIQDKNTKLNALIDKYTKDSAGLSPIVIRERIGRAVYDFDLKYRDLVKFYCMELEAFGYTIENVEKNLKNVYYSTNTSNINPVAESSRIITSTKCPVVTKNKSAFAPEIIDALLKVILIFLPLMLVRRNKIPFLAENLSLIEFIFIG